MLSLAKQRPTQQHSNAFIFNQKSRPKAQTINVTMNKSSLIVWKWRKVKAIKTTPRTNSMVNTVLCTK